LQGLKIKNRTEMGTNINLNVFKDFVKSNNFGGILLFLCVILSLAVANSPLSQPLQDLLDTVIGFENETVHLNYSVSMWINDGLMAIFFLLVGLEIKREIVEGELSSPKKAIMPILCAIGGALVPAAIFFALNSGAETAAGWAIPMATDIAFALAVISLLDKRVLSRFGNCRRSYSHFSNRFFLFFRNRTGIYRLCCCFYGGSDFDEQV
jgi:NhaA family Na+:H+ antiporter